MSNNNHNLKRKDPMKGLIVLAVLMALLTAGAFILGGMIDEYRADKLSAMRHEVNLRNQEKYEAYEQEVAEFKAGLTSSKGNAKWPEASQQGFDVVDLTHYPLEIPGTVTVNRADIMNNGLLLVNEWHSRPQDFDEQGIVSVAGYSRDSGLNSFVENNTCKLFPQAIDAIIAMLKDAKAVGLEHYVLKAGYTYRSYDEQNKLFQEQVEYYRSRYPSYSDEKVIERAKNNVNYPGTSDFNSGLTFRVYLYDGEDRSLGSANLFDTMQGKWLLENSWKYGIVFRFPVAGYPTADTADKAYKTGVNTGYNYFRYVDVPHAAVMHHLDLCLEEYIEYLMDHPHFAVYQDGKLLYEVTRQQVGDDVASFRVDITRKNSNYKMYLDNMGGVVTVYTY